MVNKKGCEAAIRAIARDFWAGDVATRCSARAIAATCRAIGCASIYSGFMRRPVLVDAVSRLYGDKNRRGFPRLPFSKMKGISPYEILRMAGDRYGAIYLRDTGIFEDVVSAYEGNLNAAHMVARSKSYMEGITGREPYTAEVAELELVRESRLTGVASGLKEQLDDVR